MFLTFLVPVVLVLVVLAARGSMQKSPIQEQQDAEARARRAAGRAARDAAREADRDADRD